MNWLIAGIAALVAALMVNGLIHQERLRLWKLWQQELAEDKRRQVEEKKRQASEKVKALLRDRRAHPDAVPDPSDEQAMKDAVAEMNAAIKAEKSRVIAN